jgi:two-component system response regulator YcbB
MAALGIEDSMNPIFENYSGQLFDFSEMRKEMKYLLGKSKIQGKINIKQFIESSIVLIDEI